GNTIAGGHEDCANTVDDDNDGVTDCADPDCFGKATCCIDICTVGAVICDGNGTRTCESQTSGCLAFGTITSCNGLLCSGGQCVSTCSDQCTEGQKQCSSTGGVVECNRLVTGCTDWVGPAVCANGEVCSGGTCGPAASCANQCTLGATRCTVTGQQQTCVKLMSGCSDWTFPLACPTNETCAAGTQACAPQMKCTAGTTRCSPNLNAVETCDPNGSWLTLTPCAQSCSAGACTGAATCSPGTVRCNGSSVEACNTSGTAWLFNQSCNVGCTAGLCNDPCQNGEKRCNGAVPETCNMAGTGWSASTSCANGCYRGECMQADLVIDGVTQTLEGDLAVKNDVVIKNGGSLKVGPSGSLKLKARHITVDAASNINANDVGQETAGAGTCCDTTDAVSCRLCEKDPDNLSSYVYFAGSGYGSTGNVGYSSYYVNGMCGGTNTYCQTMKSSQTYGRQDDLSVSPGSLWGLNPGGGAIKLVAQSVDLKGQITANATGMGASGGGVLIAADTLSGNGAIQAAGGTGNRTGGNGRVKLLRGASSTFSGSVTGVTITSPMPPLDLVSGSHPVPTRVYNDGLGDLFLAWNKPFPTVNGYYYLLSTSENDMPTSANGNGTFLQAESLVIKADKLQPGANFLHIVSVDSGFNVGTVKATQKVTINTEPPSVTSTSHPDERTWYTNNAVYLQWSNAYDNANFTGYYTALDKFMNTVPSPVAANFSTNDKLLRTVDNGIWVFHIVNRDTRGAITKEAGHYVLYVGTEPEKENVSGSVFDASNNNAPLSGVTISINRGLFKATSTGSGTYTFNAEIYVGAWEVTASKTGYFPQTKQITLVKGTPLNENFTLTKMP
ncbi:MAG: hypothetical protein K1X64_22730, partial [Myxococcaceae bacterium]|nr:hypothetical protein [Myxococcaceae bacterium]